MKFVIACVQFYLYLMFPAVGGTHTLCGPHYLPSAHENVLYTL